MEIGLFIFGIITVFICIGALYFNGVTVVKKLFNEDKNER